MNTWQELVTPKTPKLPPFPPCAVADLSHFGLIRARGEDARSFLQGQLTSDINAVAPGLVQLSSYCSAKGRMLGSFWVFQRDEDLYLQLPLERLEDILKRLRMFVLRSKVAIEDASEQLARVGLAGDCADALLPFAPADEMGCETRDGLTVIRLPGDRPRFELVGPPDQLADHWRELVSEAEQTGAEFWSLMDIRAGIANIFEDTVEAFVPQMANLQLVGGVSFKKGCYTGQEIVARMQYLGKLKRRMYRAHIAANQPPQRGADLFSPSCESGQGAGRIVDVAASPDGGYEVLAVAMISSADAEDLRLGDADGPVLKLLDLPYQFDTAED